MFLPGFKLPAGGRHRTVAQLGENVFHVFVVPPEQFEHVGHVRPPAFPSLPWKLPGYPSNAAQTGTSGPDMLRGDYSRGRHSPGQADGKAAVMIADRLASA